MASCSFDTLWQRLQRNDVSEEEQSTLRATLGSMGFNKKQRKRLREALGPELADTQSKQDTHVLLEELVDSLLQDQASSSLADLASRIPRFFPKNSGWVSSLVPIGSFPMGLYSASSDLDYSVDYQGTFLEFLTEVRQAAPSAVGVAQARVPVVQLSIDSVSVELSLGNSASVLKTELMRGFLAADPRVKPLLMLLRHWAAQRRVKNSPTHRPFGLNSYVLMLTMLIYLQQQRVCPVFASRSGPHSDGRLVAEYTDLILSAAKFVSNNHDPVSVLFPGYFSWMLNVDWRDQCLSVRMGGLIDIPELISSSGSPLSMVVEDPVTLGENAARTVTVESAREILSEFARAEVLFSRRACGEVFQAPTKKRAQICHLYGRSDFMVASVERGETMGLKTVQFIRTKGLQALVKKYALIQKRHKTYDNLVSLSYQLGTSPMSSPLVQECRGLVLDAAAGYAVVSFPFRKFFNSDESNAAKLDWNSARVFEKLDGSLMTLYFGGSEWQVSSQRLPDASGSFEKGGPSMAESFWRLFGDWRLPPASAQGEYCFMFEMCLVDQPIVVRHEKDSLHLLGARSLKAPKYQELDLQDVRAMFDRSEWQIAHSYPALNSLEKVKNAANRRPATDSEGFVVCDARFNRVKVKSRAWVALALLGTTKNDALLEERRLLDIVLSSETDEFLAYYPDYRTKMTSLRKNITRLGDITGKSAKEVQQMLQEYFKY